MGRPKIENRVCSSCKIDYPRTSEYYYRSNRKYPGDGFGYRCKKCIEESRRVSVIRSHGLSEGDYYEMMKKQDHKCAICGLSRLEFRRNYDIDHDHKTGKVRGLLCSNCNTAIGLLHDDIEVLEKAIKYLKGE